MTYPNPFGVGVRRLTPPSPTGRAVLGVERKGCKALFFLVFSTNFKKGNIFLILVSKNLLKKSLFFLKKSFFFIKKKSFIISLRNFLREVNTFVNLFVERKGKEKGRGLGPIRFCLWFFFNLFVGTKLTFLDLVSLLKVDNCLKIWLLTKRLLFKNIRFFEVKENNLSIQYVTLSVRFLRKPNRIERKLFRPFKYQT